MSMNDSELPQGIVYFLTNEAMMWCAGHDVNEERSGLTCRPRIFSENRRRGT